MVVFKINGDGIINIEMENKSDGFFEKISGKGCLYLYIYIHTL